MGCLTLPSSFHDRKQMFLDKKTSSPRAQDRKLCDVVEESPGKASVTTCVTSRRRI